MQIKKRICRRILMRIPAGATRELVIDFLFIKNGLLTEKSACDFKHCAATKQCSHSGCEPGGAEVRVGSGDRENTGVGRVTAGASAPEELVREVIDVLAAHRRIAEEVVVTAEENMVFKLPRGLEPAAT